MNGLMRDQAALDALISEPRFLRLEKDTRRPFSLIRALGVHRNELAHSRIIEALFDPSNHDGADRFARHFSRLLLERTPPPVREAFEPSLTDAGLRVTRVRREYGHIDVLLELETKAGAVAIAIENKIDADEGHRQVARYQELLARTHGAERSLMVFLTPDGRAASTADPSSHVAQIAIGYELVHAAIVATLEDYPPTRREHRVLSELASHLKEEIMGENERETADRARAIWADHAQALELLIRHRPCLADIGEAFEKRITERFGADVSFSHWPTGARKLQEIGLRRPSWEAAGLPFVIQLYSKPAEDMPRPTVRLLVEADYVATRFEALEAWARRTNAAAGHRVVDEKFSPIANWPHWRRVLPEDDYPADAAIPDLSFSSATVEEAFRRVVALTDRVAPYIDRAK